MAPSRCDDVASAMDAVSPLAHHTTFDDSGRRGSPAAASLFASPRSAHSAHGHEEGPPPVLSVLARLLEHTVGQNERRETPARSGEAENLFCGQRPPAVPLAAYLARIFRYANCSPSCYVFAFIYLERLMQNDPKLRITALSVHRLLITAVLVAAKFLDDSYFNNAYYAKVGGISLEEMNALELDFLLRCDFRLHVVPEAFDDVCERLATLLTPEDMEEGLQGDPAVTGTATPAQTAEEQSDRRAVAFA